MIVEVCRNGDIRLSEESDFKRFHIQVSVPAESYESVRDLVSDKIELSDADTGWVSIDGLRRVAGVSENTTWQENLTAMIEKARPYGWIDDTRRAIKAHVVWAE